MPTPATIEILARALVVCADHVLVCRHVSKGGYLVLPGGHVDPGEPASHAAGRELEEESGLRLPVGPCLCAHEQVFEQNGKARHELTLVFHVEHPPIILPGVPPDLVSPEAPKVTVEWLPFGDVRGADLRPTPIRDWVARRIVGESSTGTPRIDWIS